MVRYTSIPFVAGRGFNQKFCFRVKRNSIAPADRQIVAGVVGLDIVNSRFSVALTRNVGGRCNLYNPFVGNSANTGAETR